MQRETRLGKEAYAAFLKWLGGIPRPNLSVAVAVVVMYILMPTVATTYHATTLGGLWRHALSVFSHANIFHLAANVYCILLFRFRPNWLLALLVAFVATFIPAPVWSWKEMGFVIMPTCGISGAILAAVANGFARHGDWRRLMRYVVLPILPLTLVPNINTPIHLYCIILAYITTKKR